MIADLREHIAAARAQLSPETEAAVRSMLDRLGDPMAIVAEAAVGEPTAAQAVPLLPLSRPPEASPAPRRNRALVVVLWVLAAVIVVPLLVCVIGLIAFRTNLGNEQGTAPVVSQVDVTGR